jgi:hypothetical protein
MSFAGITNSSQIPLTYLFNDHPLLINTHFLVSVPIV